jgi:hypothetical protein
MSPKEKLELLFELKTHIETRSFQELIMKPLFAELDNSKNAYDCNTLAELRTVKGKKQGLMFLIDLLKGVELDIKNTKYEIETSEEGQ